MSTSLQDLSGNVVNADPTSKGLIVQNPKVLSQAGFANMTIQRDAGTIVGTAQNGSPTLSPDSRLSVGLDSILINTQFNYSAQNTNIWSNNATTMTFAYTTGGVVLNNGSSVAAGANAVLKSYRPIPLFMSGAVHVEWRMYLTQVPQVNNTVYIGVGTPGTTAAPTDGCYFQFDSTGAFKCVTNYSSVINQSASFTAPSVNTVHKFAVNISSNVAEFYIDGVLYTTLTVQAGNGTVSMGTSGFVFVQNTNVGAVTTAQQCKIFTILAHLYDTASNREWPLVMAGQGMMGLQGQDGGTYTQTAQYANSANPTAAVPTNTTAALGSGLGGIFLETASLAVNTDGIICSYQNPAGSITQAPRNLIIFGYRWVSMVQTVLAGGPFVYECGLSIGSTNVSQATTDAATAKAPRRIPVGLYSFAATAPVGTAGANFSYTFKGPLVVQPGEFVQTIVRNVGTVGTSGTIAHMIFFDAIWE